MGRINLFFASGSSPLYLDVVVESMALPRGGVVTLRYRRRYIDQEILTRLERSDIVGERAMVVYTNQEQDPDGAVFVPCRCGVICSVSMTDRYVVARVVVDDYVATRDGVEFAVYLKSCKVPAPYKKNEGFYWASSDAVDDIFAGVTTGSSVGIWQSAVDGLVSMSDFADKYNYNFYSTEILSSRDGSGRWDRACRWICKKVEKCCALGSKFFGVDVDKVRTAFMGSKNAHAIYVQSGSSVNFRLNFYNCKVREYNNEVSLSCDSKVFTVLGSNVFPVENEYDCKEFNAVVVRTPVKMMSYINISSRPKNGTVCASSQPRGGAGAEIRGVSFDVPVVIRGDLLRTIGIVVLMGACLSFASLSQSTPLKVVSSMMTAAIAQFGMRKFW